MWSYRVLNILLFLFGGLWALPQSDPGLAGDLFACSEPNSRCTPRDLCADFDYDDLSNPTPVGVRQAGPDCPRADEICCVNILEEDTIQQKQQESSFACPDSNSRCVRFDRCVFDSSDYDDLSSPQPVQTFIRQAGIEEDEDLGNCPVQNEICCDRGNILPKEEITSEGGNCTDFAGYSCVTNNLCRDGIIKTDGAGVLVVKQDNPYSVNINPQFSKCPGDLEVCCLKDEGFGSVDQDLVVQPKIIDNYQPKCGRHRPEGFGVNVAQGTRSVGLRQSRIPDQAQFAEWPAMCALFRLDLLTSQNIFIGGASLLTPGVALTAAHLLNNTSTPGMFTVRCGDWNVKQENEPLAHQDRVVEDITIHPRFNPVSVVYDVAVLSLEDDFILAPNIDTVCLPEEGESSYLSDACVATGWGVDNFDDGEYQTIMKQTELPMVSNSECQDALRTTRLGMNFTLHRSFVCAGGVPGEDTCRGDGGGPIMCPLAADPETYVQVGITSWGVGCGENMIPGVYASIEESLCFIKWAVECKHGADYQGLIDTSGCEEYIDEELQSINIVIKKIEANIRRSPNRVLKARREANLVAYTDLLIRTGSIARSCVGQDPRDSLEEERRNSEVRSSLPQSNGRRKK